MIKKITLLTALLTLSGCSTYYEMKNCDPEKNYLNINPEAIEEYKELVKNGEIKSYYLKIIPTKPCEDNKCLYINSHKYDFQEKYFNDSTRKGIYTITISDDENNKSCINKEYSSDKNCYIVNKNINNEIKSRFQLDIYTDHYTNYRKFIDLKTNIILFESSFQRYHIPNLLDVPSSGLCKTTKTPSNYEFDILDYP